MDLSPMSQAIDDLSQRARITGQPRSEARSEMLDGRMKQQAAGQHKGAHRPAMPIGSMESLRRGKRGRVA